MEATVKEIVKNIFKSNTFEAAFELTREYRSEYLAEFGIKSRNSLVSYYKKANIIPESNVAEPEPEYGITAIDTSDEASEDVDDEDSLDIEDNEEEEEEADTLSSEDDSEAEEAEESEPEEERVEYMLYQNAGDKVDWYGHYVNHKGLKVGDEAMMVRMNNLGVGMGKVIATAQMTMEEIGVFHRCYASIRADKISDNIKVMLFERAFNNLKDAMRDPAFPSKSSNKEIELFVLHYSE